MNPEHTRTVRQSSKERNRRRRLIQVLDEALRINDMVLESMGEIVEIDAITSSWTQGVSSNKESRALCGNPR